MSACLIYAESQNMGLKGIQLAIPSRHFASISGVTHPSPREPLVFSKLTDPAYAGKSLSLIVRNLDKAPLLLDPKVPIAYVQLLKINDVSSLTTYNSL